MLIFTFLSVRGFTLGLWNIHKSGDFSFSSSSCEFVRQVCITYLNTSIRLFILSVPYNASCPRKGNQSNPVTTHLICRLCLFMSLYVCVCVCAYVWTLHVCLQCWWYAWLSAGQYWCCDAKQQKKRRLSRKVNREERGRYPSQKPIHFRGQQGYLFLFLWKRRQFLQVTWQPAWGQLDTSSADIWRRT